MLLVVIVAVLIDNDSVLVKLHIDQICEHNYKKYLIKLWFSRNIVQQIINMSQHLNDIYDHKYYNYALCVVIFACVPKQYQNYTKKC